MENMKTPVFSVGKQFARKLGLLALALFLLGGGSALAQDAKVSIHKRQALIRTILEQIESQTDYLFIYNTSVRLDRQVDVDVDRTPVSDVLTRILKGTDVQFTLQGKHIILSDRPNRPEARTGVRGKVVGADGQPVIGASVVAAGGHRGRGGERGRARCRIPRELGKKPP